MTFISIGVTNQAKTRFQPGIWLWLFTGFFLPLFLLLGNWQLNRAYEKEQLLTKAEELPLPLAQVNWREVTVNQRAIVSGRFLASPIIYMDNKIYNGQVGYEIFALLSTSDGALALSLGWLAGSPERSELPMVALPITITDALVMVRNAPKNALFDVAANEQRAQQPDIWVSQSLTADWLSQISGQTVLGFAQLLASDRLGVGPNIWQATVMTPTRHRAYAWQWFAMALALAAMFVYAGLRPDRAVSRITTKTEIAHDNDE